MKNFKAVAATEIVATIEIEAEVMFAKYRCSGNVASAFVEKHPEYKGCKTSLTYKNAGKTVIINFLAISEVIFEEYVD